jgi:hypothetical protein
MEGRAVGHNFERDPPRTIPGRFGLIWFSGFRGEDWPKFELYKHNDELFSMFDRNFYEL